MAVPIPHSPRRRGDAAITAVVADGHVLVRQGVKALLERANIEILAEASDGLEAIQLVEAHQPDIMILEFSMPIVSGLSALGVIRKVSPATKSILLTMHIEERHILQALRAGAKGCVWKTQAIDELLQAIRDVCGGGVYLSPSISGALVEAYLDRRELPPDPLTDRERQVLQLIAEGKTTKEVAVILGVASKTAETHRTKLMQKLDLHSTAALVRYAVRRGFIEP
jgi:two-component system, NarL family, response regulator NreC